MPPLAQATIPSPNPQHPFLTKHPERALPTYTPPSPGPTIQCSAHCSQDKAPPLTQRAQKAPGTTWPSYLSSCSLTCTSPSTTLNIIPCLPVPFLWPSPSPPPATDQLLFPSGLCQKAPSFGALSHTPGPGVPPLLLHGACQAVCILALSDEMPILRFKEQASPICTVTLVSDSSDPNFYPFPSPSFHPGCMAALPLELAEYRVSFSPFLRTFAIPSAVPSSFLFLPILCYQFLLKIIKRTASL